MQIGPQLLPPARPRSVTPSVMASMPYIMPDGRKMTDVLKQERRKASSKAGKSTRGSDVTGKQEQANLVALLASRARSSAAAPATGQQDHAELAELRALEAAGVRRRRRWLNEKHLRDLAGPLTAADMSALFNPVPFGGMRDSPLTQIREDPEAAAVWDSFRNIDPEKESKVLQKWEEYNASLRSTATASTTAPSGATAAAAAALRCWSAISKPARQALRKANVHSVLALETQLLDLLEQGDPSARVTLLLEDTFGRMLVHGLAQFHGLMSVTSKEAAGGTAVMVHFRPSRQAGDSDAVVGPPEITCTDVLLAMAELGSNGLTHDGLSSFVRKHIHGLSSSESASDAGDWVVV